MKRACRVLLVDLGSDRPEINEPIGLGALTSFLHSSLGDRCEIRQIFVQLRSMPKPEEIRWADVLGLSTRLCSLTKVHRVVDELRRVPESERPVLVLGDLIATFATKDLLEVVPEAICVLGEGEESLAGIVKAWLDTAGDSRQLRRVLLERAVPNLVFMDRGLPRSTERRLVDLDAMPSPDRSFVAEVAQSGGIIRAEASRGCAWGLCNFCAIQFKYCDSISWRAISTERIVAELAEMSELGVRSPFYTDEDFIGDDPIRAVAVARAIKEARAQGRIAPDITLYVDARVDTILAPARKGRPSGEDVFRELASAGLREVFVGIESGASDQVRRYRKAATARRNIAAINLLQGLGISLDVGFIMFDPEMRFEELRLNLEFIDEAGLKSHDARLTKQIRCEPGTPMVQEYRDKNLITGPLDANELIYPYRWVDPMAEAVHAAFSAWESQRMESIYEIQASTRGETPNEYVRRWRREYLGRIRTVELDSLWEIVRCTEDGQDPLSVDLSQFSRARGSLISEWQTRRDVPSEPMTVRGTM